ncbi:MAG: flagellar motor protein MotB [Thermodesulfobacteriota bacterium]|nr:flagellar motor protein MotB [Thermodesulfobacteriota bacterium]
MSDNDLDPNAWMVTFADLVMLLLTFFVLLLTMSSMDTKKLRNLMTHFTETTGVLEFASSGKVSEFSSFISQYNNSDSMLVIDQKDFLSKIKISLEIKDMLKDINEKINLSDDERGVVLSFNENILFDPGKAIVKKEIFPVLDAVADAIYECPNDIQIMGHTDNIPIKSKLYKSNWELSAYRGLSVLDYFLKEKELSPSRFYVGGCGSFRPIHPNDTPKNRSLNRRVEIIFQHI